ncbi:MAG: 50S ribosomal protein L11 methyltransferase [Vicingaceae bacterium]
MEPWAEVFIQDLANIGFEAFELNSNEVYAYIVEGDFKTKSLQEIILGYQGRMKINYTQEVIIKRNWNKEWESNFHPVILTNGIGVRAHFHPVPKNIEYDLIITPKMSFGTGHHDTTRLMLTEMMNLDFHGKSVLDVGSGTGILAIMAEKLSASRIMAIDIEDWAVENAKENASVNNCHQIVVEKAEIHQVKDISYNVILANINYNVIMNDLQSYSERLSGGGDLLLSGFLKKEIEEIVNAAKQYGISLKNHRLSGDWALLHLTKTS